MLTTYENAHKSGKCLQFTNMLTTCENTHNLRKYSQLTKMLTLMTYKNAHNLKRKMFTTCENATTTCENAHNLQKCMLTTENQYYNLQKCSHLSRKYETLVHKCGSSPPPLLNAECLQHLTPAMLHLSQTCEPGPIANGHDFPWLRRAVPLCYIFCTTRGAGPQNRDVVYLFNSIECWDSIPKRVQMIMVYIRQSPTPTFS